MKIYFAGFHYADISNNREREIFVIYRWRRLCSFFFLEHVKKVLKINKDSKK